MWHVSLQCPLRRPEPPNESRRDPQPRPQPCAHLPRSNLDSDGVEDRTDHKARSTSLGLAPAFLFKPDMPGFQGMLTSYSDGACVPLPLLCRPCCVAPAVSRCWFQLCHSPLFLAQHVINSERAAAASELLGLESLGWVDNLTRALAVELSTFTPGTNIFSTLTLVRAPRSSVYPFA